MSTAADRLPFLERHADIIFSVKTFIAAMMALMIGFAADLPRPYWALATVYITSQPLAGATRSKALYRVIGTLIGAAASIALVPNLVNSPELLSLAIAAWVGICLYVSLLDRTPRSYMFMLAGYTCALIAFPSVSEPAAIFDTAIARSQEIIVGILCATVVSTVLLPRSVGPAVSARVDSWLAGARKLSQDVLAGRSKDAAARDLRLKLAADAVDLDGLADHLAFDRASSRETLHWMRALRVRMLTFLPTLSSLEDRIDALGTDARTAHPQLTALIDDVAKWIGDNDLEREPADGLRERIAAQRPDLTASSPWGDIIIASLLMRLRELVDISADCRILNQAIAQGERPVGAKLIFQPEGGVAPARYRDPGMALWSSAGAFITILVCCAFWILTGWTDGATAPMMAAIGCSFFANMDDPSVGLRDFVKWTLVAMVIIATYLFAILPAISNVEVLVFALAPSFLIFGYLIARPATFFIGMMLAANTATMMALQETYSADFASFANSSIAFFVGMELSAISIRLIRSVGSEWSVRRLMRRGWIAIAKAAEGRGNRDRAAFAGVMLNRIGVLAPRLLALKGSDLRKIDNLRELRVGLNIVDLRRARHHLSMRTLTAIDAMLDELAASFRKHDGTAMPQALLCRVDHAMAAAIDDRGAGRTDALIGLVGIRRGLFPDAPDYQPETPAHVGSVAA
ncbi:FUSC family protein [Tardiphaga alba]|uniref:FUSC family protein n=1 Tax=Tardiphaga alba TaxID=340268 RepID=A0ABX8AFG0_9BRAD|nr:FUSC family protein [Tardiphaga alba]QUS41651.1 FUSC family protein [Tardiphaga alba]